MWLIRRRNIAVMAIIGAFAGALVFAQAAVVAGIPAGGMQVWGRSLALDLGVGAVAAGLLQWLLNWIAGSEQRRTR